MISVRTACTQDIAPIKTILDRNFNEVISKYHSQHIVDKFKDYNSHESLLKQLSWKKVFVAEDDNNNIVATAAFANFGTLEAPKYSVSNFYVLPEMHSRGIGRIMFGVLLDEAKSKNAAAFHVPSTANAIGFYQRMGFMISGEQLDTEDEITWLIMQL